MKFEEFISGSNKQQYQYMSFQPSPINHGWSWEDPRINVLLGLYYIFWQQNYNTENHIRFSPFVAARPSSVLYFIGSVGKRVYCCFNNLKTRDIFYFIATGRRLM